MKKRMFGLLASVMLSVFLLAGCGSSPAASTSGSGSGDYHGALKGVELAVGTSGTYAPFSYFDKDGTTLTGYDVELMGKLQEILGFTLKDGAMKDMDYGPLGTSLSQGQLDVGAAALCATDERKKTMKFSDTYYDAGIVVIVAKDNTAIKSVDDLKTGKYKVAVQTGCAAYEYAAANLPESSLQSFDSQALAYKAVEDGQADATIYDLPGTNYGIKTGAIQVKTVGDEFYKGQAPYALAFSMNIVKKYPHIIDDFNSALQELKENGTLDELNHAWWAHFWSHTYTDWSQIEAPSYKGETSVHGLDLDWKRFVTYQSTEFMKHEIAAVKAVDPSLPVTANFMGMYAYGLDYYKMGVPLDVISWDAYPEWHAPWGDHNVAMIESLSHDMMRSLKKRSFLLMECTPSTTNWRPVSKLKKPGMHKLSAVNAIAHGADSVCYFQKEMRATSLPITITSLSSLKDGPLIIWSGFGFLTENAIIMQKWRLLTNYGKERISKPLAQTSRQAPFTILMVNG